jgi:type II secretory pathway pseudopilin PulG
MSPRSRSNTVSRGFTLIEATISMTLLLVVLVLSMAFLFAMRTFSQRQELFTSPRQTARRAIDYLSYYVAGASDMFQSIQPGENNPNAIVVWTNSKYPAAGTPIQNTWDNVANTAYADASTDIISLAVPTSTGINAQYDPSGGDYATGSTGTVAFMAGCGGTNDDAANLALFKRLTGADSTGQSALLMLAGGSGTWGYLRITGYGASDCGGTQTIAVNVTPGNSMAISAPSATALSPNYVLKAGVLFSSFRVKGGQLQQKTGLFLPATPDAGFTPLLDNVEDFQVAYIYSDGSIWNSAAQTLATTNRVPPQGTTNATDVVNVIGLRITVVARSSELPVTILSRARYNRPAAENHAAGAKDRFYHYRMTATVMLRNRMLGG